MTGALVVAALLGLAAQRPDTGLGRAETLLVQGDLQEARAILEQRLRHDDRDIHALTLLGRVHLAWPVVGRFRAWRLFEQAARLDPTDPEPRYQQVQVGLYLADDDGERMARDAIFKILQVTPDYRDIWTIWNRFYRGDNHRRRAVSLLARYGDPTSIQRRAGLLIELDQHATADSLLAALIARGVTHGSVWALRAQAWLELGDAALGHAYYDRAVARASSDSLGVLWSHIAAIASPEEEAQYHSTPPGERAIFFRAFWDHREPDLTTDENERVAEHFTRFRTARRDYRLLHPMSRFHRSVRWRALRGDMAQSVLSRLQGFQLTNGVIPGRSLFEDEIQQAGLGVDVRDLPEPDSVTRYTRFGLDGRGLLYLRFGEPAERFITVGPGTDVEAWRYEVDGQPVSLTFARATNRGGGDFVLYPTSRRELHNGAIMLERDASATRAELPLDVWVATFRPADHRVAEGGRVEVYVHANADTAASALWDLDGLERTREWGATPLVLRAPPGTYRFGADARRGEHLGRVRGVIDVADLTPGWLSLSSVLVGVVRDTAPDRAGMARAMPPDLTIERRGEALTVYAEVYDLPAVDGVLRYEVTYAFVPDRERGAGSTFTFTRTAPQASIVTERLLVQPGQVPSGTYQITLTVRDLVLGLEAKTVRVNVTLR